LKAKNQYPTKALALGQVPNSINNDIIDEMAKLQKFRQQTGRNLKINK
jgi:hypothetical protein